MKCDICGTELWTNHPRVLLMGGRAEVGVRLEVCRVCYNNMMFLRGILSQRTVMDDAGAAAVHREVD
jgi:hypothetical protein